MTPKTPVVLLVLVQADGLRWFVAAVGYDGAVLPLLRSEDGDLAGCRGLPFDDQVAFLRHRFCGVLQRGCDHLWGRDLKAGQFAIIFDGPLPDCSGELIRATADHFVTWMLNPPVVVFFRPNAGAALELVAGCPQPADERLLCGSLVALAAVDPAAWERSPRKPCG